MAEINDIVRHNYGILRRILVFSRKRPTEIPGGDVALNTYQVALVNAKKCGFSTGRERNSNYFIEFPLDPAGRIITIQEPNKSAHILVKLLNLESRFPEDLFTELEQSALDVPENFNDALALLKSALSNTAAALSPGVVGIDENELIDESHVQSESEDSRSTCSTRELQDRDADTRRDDAFFTDG